MTTAALAAKPLSIAVLGIGRMGLPMARRLCQAGHTVHVWNRTRAKAEALATDGATVHDNAADAAGQADTTLSLLENGPAVAQVLGMIPNSCKKSSPSSMRFLAMSHR